MTALKVIIAALPFFVCLPCLGQGKNNPNLSEQRLKELMGDSTLFPKTEVRYTDTIPAGIKYAEIREVDPASPPVLIDIVGNMENKKAFKLSDVASSTKYVILRPPSDKKFTNISGIVSDNEHIFVNTKEGLFCYSADGRYLYTVVENVLEEGPYGTSPISGMLYFNNIDLLDGTLVARTLEDRKNMFFAVFDVAEMDAQMRFNFQPQEVKTVGANPQYKRRITGHPFFMPTLLLNNDQSLFGSNLTLTSFYGDTLCKFIDYDSFNLLPVKGSYVNVRSNSYRFDGQVMLLKAHNDTVYCVKPPNRLTPAYVMHWGKYKPDINQHVAGSALEDKFVLSEWVESQRCIFIRYTEGRDYPLRRMDGKVKDRWAIYDKTAKTLTHALSDKAAMREINGTVKYYEPMPAIIENDIDQTGMPFWPEGVNHNNEMYMIFSKKQLEIYLNAGKFQKDKLQATYSKMPDDGFCLMLVK